MYAPERASLAEPKPSSLHTTLAEIRSHRWSTTVPHFPSCRTSTLPSPRRGPDFRRTDSYERRKQINKVTFRKSYFTTSIPKYHGYYNHIWCLRTTSGTAFPKLQISGQQMCVFFFLFFFEWLILRAPTLNICLQPMTKWYIATVRF